MIDSYSYRYFDFPFLGTTDKQALRVLPKTAAQTHTGLPDDNRALEPPDSIPNSDVKRCIADGSVGSPHVRVGHRQASNTKPRSAMVGVFYVTPH